MGGCLCLIQGRTDQRLLQPSRRQPNDGRRTPTQRGSQSQDGIILMIVIGAPIGILEVIILLSHEAPNDHLMVYEVVHDACIDHDTTELLAQTIHIMGASQMVLTVQSCRNHLQALRNRLRLDFDIEEYRCIVIIVKASDGNGLILELLPGTHHLRSQIHVKAVLLLNMAFHFTLEVHQIKGSYIVDLSIISILSFHLTQLNQQIGVCIVPQGHLSRGDIKVIIEGLIKINLLRVSVLSMFLTKYQLTRGLGVFRSIGYYYLALF